MSWPSRIVRARRPRCEPLEGRLLLAAALDYPRLASAMRAASQVQTPALFVGPPRSVDLDLDGDGLPDHAELSSQSDGCDRLDIFHRLGDGNLEPVRQTTLGHVARSLLAGDFDADGRPDLFAAGEVSGQGTLLLNRGAGDFEVRGRGLLGLGLAVGDLTGDGRDDFVYANPALDHVVVDVAGLGKTLLADGPTGAISPNQVYLADLNGDGRLDLLVCTGAGLLVYPGLGGGRFGDEVSADLGLAGTGPARVTVGYLNDQDGEEYDPYPDLIVTHVGDGKLSVFLGEGGWRMRPAGEYWAGPSPSAVLSDDVTGDGRADLVVTSGDSGSVQVLPGLGGGRFDDRSPRLLPAGPRPLMSFVGDFDGDHLSDLAVVNAGSNDVTVYPDVASASPRARTVASGGDGPVAALMRDVNGDGMSDLVVAHLGDGRLSLLLGGGLGLRLVETVASPAGRPAALAPSLEPWKVYVAGEDGEEAALVSFTPILPEPRFSPDLEGEGGDVPMLPGPRPEAKPRLEPLSAGAIGLFPTLITPLHEDAPEGPPLSQSEGDEGPEESAPVRAKTAANLSGGGEEAMEAAEAGEPVAALTSEQSVQRFLLGVEDAPPAVAADGSTQAVGVAEDPWAPTPPTWAEDEPPSPELATPPSDEDEPPDEVAAIEALMLEDGAGSSSLHEIRPPDEGATVEALLLVVALILARDQPVTGRRRDGVAW